jgi:hypothetical protein
MFNEQGTVYYIRSADANAYYVGDAVLSTAQGDTNGVPGMIKATVGTETLRGVMMGAYFPAPGAVSLAGAAVTDGNIGIPATKAQAYYILVADDPSILYIIQDDGITGASLVATNANKNFSLTIAAGATLQSHSGTVMLSSSLATTAGLNMKALGIAQVVNQGNAPAFGAFALWNAKINQHEFQGNTAGV